MADSAWDFNLAQAEREAGAFARLTTTVVCNPADEAGTRRAVEASMRGIEPPHPRVRVDERCPAGEVYVIDATSARLPWEEER